MAQTIVQINFRFSISSTEFEQVAAPSAQPIAEVVGLQWKIWLINDAKHEAGGIYLFTDAAAAQAYLHSPIVAQIETAPFLSDLSVKLFNVMDEWTEITRGPIKWLS